MAGRGRAGLKHAALLYTAQDVASFCEVDLKTIHHWAERGKIPHHRTQGGHLRFRRNDVVRFLRAHTYPVPEELGAVRPQVALAPPPVPAQGTASWPSSADEVAKKLAARFVVRRMPSAVVALAAAVADGIDAVVLPLEDPSLGGARTVAALKTAPETAWIAIAAVGEAVALEEARAAGADLVLASRDVASLARELARVLAV